MKLSAFVGHSFTDEDKDIVNYFLQELTTISKSIPGFEWDHAKGAESKDLRKKVLEKIEGKDIFIGICTKKEAVIKCKDLGKKCLFSSDYKIAKDQIEYKTSDWIIQEIGLSIGRGMDLILLVENGVRMPGGLQGNIEYISFERENSYDAVYRLSQMVLSMKNSVRESGKMEVVESDENQENKEENKKPEIGESLKREINPSENWEYNQYIDALFALEEDKEDQKQNELISFAREKGRLEENKVIELECEKFFIRQMLRDTNESFDELKKLANENKGSREIWTKYVRLLRFEGLNESGLEIAKEWKEKENGSRDKFVWCRVAIGFLNELKRFEEARSILNEMHEFVHSEDMEEYLKLRAENAKELGDSITFCMLNEKILVQNPNIDHIRFSLAYTYGKLSWDDMAYKHYRILSTRRGANSDYNNCGVTAGKLGISGKSIFYYEKSIEKGGTLASSNIAKKYISLGFFTKARELCLEALKEEKCDEQVSRTLADLNESLEEENTKENEAIDKANNFSSVIIEASNKSGENKIGDSELTFVDGEISYKLFIKDGYLSSSYVVTELEKKGRIGRLLGIGLKEGETRTVEYRITIKGALSGKSGSFEWKKSKVNEDNTSILGSSTERSGIIVFDDDLNWVEYIEKDMPIIKHLRVEE